MVALGLVLEDGVALAVGAQADAVAQAVHLVEVLLPQLVDGVEDGVALDGHERVGVFEADLELVGLLGLGGDVVEQQRLVRGQFPFAIGAAGGFAIDQSGQ